MDCGQVDRQTHRWTERRHGAQQYLQPVNCALGIKTHITSVCWWLLENLWKPCACIPPPECEEIISERKEKCFIQVKTSKQDLVTKWAFTHNYCKKTERQTCVVLILECLMPRCCYLNQCWPIISKVLGIHLRPFWIKILSIPVIKT